MEWIGIRFHGDHDSLLIAITEITEVRKYSMCHHAASFSMPCSWCKPPVSATSFDCHDALGRVGQSRQLTGAVDLLQTYRYVASGMKTAMLPSGRLLSYGLDDLGRAVSGFSWELRIRRWWIGCGTWCGLTRCAGRRSWWWMRRGRGRR